jgi:UvrD/REP helicase N-terminal domain
MQAHRERDAIYSYLTAVFDLVAWWTAENCALARARKALRLQNIWPSDHDEPFAAIIRCTSDHGKVDKRTRSKWSRVLRYSAEKNRIVNRLPCSLAAKVESTNVLHDLPAGWGGAVEVTLNTATELLQRGPVFSALTRFIDLQARHLVTAAAESENVGRKRSAPMAYDYLSDLNREQLRAVKHGVSDGSAPGGNPLLVIAGAGTGKTKTLARRVAPDHRIGPQQCLA